MSSAENKIFFFSFKVFILLPLELYHLRWPHHPPPPATLLLFTNVKCHSKVFNVEQNTESKNQNLWATKC